MKKLLILLTSILLLSSCNKLDDKYNAKTYAKDILEIRQSNPKDAELIGRYVLKSFFSNTELEGMTYSDIRDSAQAKIDRDSLMVKLESERVDNMRKILSIKVLNKTLIGVDYSKFYKFDIVIENTSNKNIRSYKGSLVFKDLFGEEISRYGVSYDDGIKSKGKLSKNPCYDYNEYRNSDRLLRNKEMKDVIVEWIPENILFEDGTKL